ncbi:hypothetical protein PISL3812_04097 [Talaromyces islandicus]|uniref:Pre-rRNA-processing protein RIX1 n=1 Tax=Talaromyces islandicus TaxID=28573 RepID=A0A0U1LVF6_TALIS|nr:hypothetical protein PISL3812_04097 [Talaromyces islandicus]
MRSSTSLRAITHRLTTTPVQDLPHVAPYVAASLGDCSDIISSPQAKKAANSDDNDALLVNKLKARVTSLVQDRTPQGRWTGVVLVKATVEAGQWEILHECAPWVRGLLSILSKPDPISTKRLSIITLTRIFHLTYQYPTLVREITTPNLPTFITALLNLVTVKQPNGGQLLSKEPLLLETVLSAFTELIGRHPTIFRPFSNQLQNLLLPIVGSSTLSSPLSAETVHLAQALFVSLHHCAPKNTSSEKWTKDCKHSITSIHQTADHIFRSVVEQWESSNPQFKPTQSSIVQGPAPGDDGSNALGLPPWQGVNAGATRVVTLLGLLSHFISAQTQTVVNVPIGAILDLTSRLTAVTFPAAGDDNTQANRDFSREERVALWSELPRIHTACIGLFRAIARTLGSSLISVAQSILEQTTWVFEAEFFNSYLRTSCYLLMAEILPLVGPSMSKANVFSVATLIRKCCHDLIPADDNRTSKAQNSEPKAKSKGTQAMNVDAFLNPAHNVSQTKDLASTEIYSAALQLLPLLYNTLPVEYIPLPLRTDMDRAAILTADRAAMSSSVMNPMPPVKGRRTTPSILPFLARRHSKEVEVECLLRPRMPVIIGSAGSVYEADDYEEEQDDASHVPVTVSALSNAQDASSAATNEVEKHTTQSQNKRDHLDENNPKRPNDLPQEPQLAKKARLEEGSFSTTFRSTPVTLSEVTPSPVVVPSASTPHFSAVSSSVAAPVESSAFPGVVDETRNDEDSDEDMPTLNLEPDTDDDDDE